MTRSLRLIFALLTLLLAVPAMQARACAPETGGHVAQVQMGAQTSHHGHHGNPPEAPSPAKVAHDCIGCVAPIDIRAYRPATLAAHHSGGMRVQPDISFLIGWDSRPDPRPPRPLA